jgi:uncharacterized protein
VKASRSGERVAAGLEEWHTTEIQIELDVAAKMPDGAVLRADVYRPGGTGPWPVLLSRLPYGKQSPLLAAMLDPLAAVRRGFMVVIQDTRGRFASDGDCGPRQSRATCATQ